VWFQEILDRQQTQIVLYTIIYKAKAKQFYLLEIAHMQIGIHFMIVIGGTLGADLWNGVLHISHGYGQLETMILNGAQLL
jgi:hypothetical protein